MCGNMHSVQPTKAPWAHARASPSPSRGHWAGPLDTVAAGSGGSVGSPEPSGPDPNSFYFISCHWNLSRTRQPRSSAPKWTCHLGTPLTRKQACGLLGCGPSGPPPKAVKNSAPHSQAAFLAPFVPRATGQSSQTERGRGAGSRLG